MVSYSGGIGGEGKIDGVEIESFVAVCIEGVDGGAIEDCLVSHFIVDVVVAFIFFFFERISFVCCRSVILILFALFFFSVFWLDVCDIWDSVLCYLGSCFGSIDFGFNGSGLKTF